MTLKYAEVVFIQPGGKLDTTWRDDWQRLASSYQTSRWDVAVNLMVTAAGRCSLPHRRKHRNLQLVNCSSLSQTFCSPNSPDLETVNCHLGCNSADGLPSYSFSEVDKIKIAIVKSRAETTAWRSHCQFITLLPFYLRLMLFARWRHYFPRLIQINYGMMFRMRRTWFMPNFYITLHRNF